MSIIQNLSLNRRDLLKGTGATAGLVLGAHFVTPNGLFGDAAAATSASPNVFCSIDSDGTEMDDYERLDLSAEYELTPRLTPYLRVENLFDQDYEEVPGYTARGITALVGLGFDFR